MLAEELDQLVSDCPESCQDELGNLTDEELDLHRAKIKGAAGNAANSCDSTIEHLKSRPFLQDLERHQQTRADILQFFVMFTRDQTRPKTAGELAQQLEAVVRDFEADTGADLDSFLDSYFSQDTDRAHVIQSLILVALLNGGEEND